MTKGIGMVHQEFMLLPGFTITENIKLNREISRPSAISRAFGKNLETLGMKAMSQDARGALDSVGMSIDEDTLVAGLPVGSTCSLWKSPARSTKRASSCWSLMNRPPF